MKNQQTINFSSPLTEIKKAADNGLLLQQYNFYWFNILLYIKLINTHFEVHTKVDVYGSIFEQYNFFF